ncbi:Puromycin-sensitive aminopeptidase [Thalictrum thalictroides]|uniref:Puromycin-sensitive aminopeptidase n=1 Tax=Thalictrum thalictroides TaxID=46969 RepID=A0A7J6XF24_THATH|nr:Puromycin-sensitive aminopeptidase [Thalictrum thalictroides]
MYHDGILESISASGQPVHTVVRQVKKKEEEFAFSNISERPIPSILRGYSAPIRLDSDLTYNLLFFNFLKMLYLIKYDLISLVSYARSLPRFYYIGTL